MTIRDRKLPLLALVASLLAGGPALATNTYPSYLGPNYSFSGIQETSTQGDPELPPAGPPLGTCCWGAPTGVGDQLLFSPPTFEAQASGAGGSDSTGAQLQTLITATALGATIDQIYLSEYGDLTLGGGANAGTGVFASMAGFVTVLEVNGVGVTPTVISFNAQGPNPFGVTGGFSPADVGDGDYNRANYPVGVALWNGLLVIDVEAIVPNATMVQLSFDDDLYAYSEAVGDSAEIRKTSVVIAVVPEPGTALLLAGGLLVLGLRARALRR
jgi:hypothetical protein